MDFSVSQRVIGAVLIALSLGYLVLFVPRGWVPHDEGMIGQSGERVMRGDIPHVDYEEPYTGGLSLLYAGLFKVVGIDLRNVRWLLFAGAVVGQMLIYLILRRYLSPIGAGAGAGLALTWSYPNFFAGLPSWWLLICALACLWAFMRFIDTRMMKYAAAAGLASGLAIVVKQTGVYLLIALVMSLLYEGGSASANASTTSRIERAFSITVAVVALLFALAILRSRLALAELLYLLLPIAACSRLLVTARAGSLRPVITAAAFACLPFAVFVVPYLIHGQLWALAQGLVILPQKRLVFAATDMPSAAFILLGLPLVALVMTRPKVFESSTLSGRLVSAAMWIAAVALLVASLYNEISYQMVWQAARASAALLPVAICWRLITGHIVDETERRILFGVAAISAWASLGQFPFGAPIYFCYVAPLAIVAGVAAMGRGPHPARVAIGACAALFLAFAVLSMNRGYIYNLGQAHAPQAMDTNLDLPRAHLRVSASDADMYRRVVALVERHAGAGDIIAGPDCPEVYFLTGRVNPSGAMFDFFLDDESESGFADTAAWDHANVVVLNHRAAFSPGFSPALEADIRRVFAQGESIGRLEVRWR